jgi:hypothetical protein
MNEGLLRISLGRLVLFPGPEDARRPFCYAERKDLGDGE